MERFVPGANNVGVQKITGQIEYEATEASVLATIIERVTTEWNFVETYTINKGIKKKWGDKAVESLHKKIGQIHMREGFKPVDWTKLSQQEKSRVIKLLIFMVEKRDGTIKSRLCANGSKQCNWISKEDTSSPTASIELILLTAAIDAKEKRIL